MLNFSNALSLLRLPLACLFLINNTPLRIFIIIVSMMTDIFDGYLARKYRMTTKFGAILDPIMDKFFVFFVLGVLTFEDRLLLWEAGSMVSRDFFLLIFGTYLKLSGKWHVYPFRALSWGKVTTALQFLVLIGLCLHIIFPWPVYLLFILLGALAFIELCQRKAI